MKKLFITGGTGFLGSRIIKKYSEKYEIISATSKVLDITNDDSVYKLIKEIRPHYIIHASAVAETKFCDENTEFAYNLNVRGTVNIAKACEAVRSKLFFISTEQVFNGNTNDGPYLENDIAIPNTQYGKTKLQAEIEINKILDKVWILRLTWLFSLPERNLKINSNILWETLTTAYKQSSQIASKREFRGMTYVYDLVDQFDKIFDIDSGIYHVGSSNNFSRYDIAKYIMMTIGLSNDKIDELLIPKAGYLENKRDIRLNTDKIKSKGIYFDDTKDTLIKCMKEFNMLI
ncbi:sugar nucleotide-binding protein [Alkalibaculum sp. M08DMB]|uniref:dTDP-4-dehydrorhamnose reductase n=1 Tax=Alkalibaculum sporogenes TaxID=2655001 RepID=A0A6A7K9N8_9FIRM|nr:sugar nucleotide-binding protein [Alkalibaculum sporogenes]MPW26075.1 sugar nucleotide-binding protein [Alkalibaculum sporogenes]